MKERFFSCKGNGVLPGGGSSGTASQYPLACLPVRARWFPRFPPRSRMPHTARYTVCCSCPSLEHTHAKEHPHCTSLTVVHSLACYTWLERWTAHREISQCLTFADAEAAEPCTEDTRRSKRRCESTAGMAEPKLLAEADTILLTPHYSLLTSHY